MLTERIRLAVRSHTSSTSSDTQAANSSAKRVRGVTLNLKSKADLNNSLSKLVQDQRGYLSLYPTAILSIGLNVIIKEMYLWSDSDSIPEMTCQLLIKFMPVDDTQVKSTIEDPWGRTHVT